MLYQKRLAYQINEQMRQTLSLLTQALHIHLNTGQNFTMNTVSIVMTVGRLSLGSLLNQNMQQNGSGYIHLPAHMYSNRTLDTAVSFRVCFHSSVYFISTSSIMLPLVSLWSSQSYNHWHVQVDFHLKVLQICLGQCRWLCSMRTETKCHLNQTSPIR